MNTVSQEIIEMSKTTFFALSALMLGCASDGAAVPAASSTEPAASADVSASVGAPAEPSAVSSVGGATASAAPAVDSAAVAPSAAASSEKK